jgi:hypothetical protein
MNANTRRRLSMAARAVDFLNANPDSDPTWTAVATRISDCVTRAETELQQETEGKAQEHASRAQRGTIRSALVKEMRHLTRVVQLAATEHRELAGILPAFHADQPHHLLVATAQVMLTAVTASKELLAPYGLSQALFDQMTADIAAFDSSTESSHTGRSTHVGAHNDLETTVSQAVALVGVMNGLVEQRFAGQSNLLAAWESARNIAGPFVRSKPEQPEPAPVVVPVPALVSVASDKKSV